MEQTKHQFQAQTQQLQRRISAVEEEKTIMLQHMREHIKQLARENYDLKRQCGSLHTSAQTSPLEEGERSNQAEEKNDEINFTSSSSAGGGSFLSYVLSPFLTDSDML